MDQIARTIKSYRTMGELRVIKNCKPPMMLKRPKFLPKSKFRAIEQEKAEKF